MTISRSSTTKQLKGSRKKKKIKTVMKEFKEGTLRSGSKTGRKVKSRKQAIAIAMSEGRRASRTT
jgi:hypothetical protein|tara:strand:+ start:87 stop:281 length:195 start_codon:yes stop_codon:yes gene_type:complete